MVDPTIGTDEPDDPGLVELVEGFWVDRPDQVACEERLHLVRAHLDHVSLEATGELGRRRLVRVERRHLEVEVRVRKPKAPIDGAFDTVEAALIRRRA